MVTLLFHFSNSVFAKGGNSKFNNNNKKFISQFWFAICNFKLMSYLDQEMEFQKFQIYYGNIHNASAWYAKENKNFL